MIAAQRAALPPPITRISIINTAHKRVLSYVKREVIMA
jgi:hypothetical protein